MYSSVHPTMCMYLLVLGLYSKILDSKKLVDFYMAEYSLEITLKDKSQTRLDPNSMVKFRVMPEFTRVLSTLFLVCRNVVTFIKSYTLEMVTFLGSVNLLSTPVSFV